MKLTRVDITNFRCFATLTVPLHPAVNVFVGVNGAGKSAILDAIAIALYDIVAANGGGGKRQRASQGVTLRPTDIHIAAGANDTLTDRRDFVQISALAHDFYELLPEFPLTTPTGAPRFIEWSNFIRYQPPNDFQYDTKQSERLNNLYRYFQALWSEVRHSDIKALIPLPVVAYYRADRCLSQMPKLGDIFSVRLERDGAFQDALNAGANYQAMLQWFYLRENQELRERLQIREDRTFEFPDLKAVRWALRKIIEGVKDIFFDENSLKVRLTNSHQESEPLELEQLSHGYRNLLAIVLDFARRLAQAHPHWEKPLEAPGILLIDEIELHLHPEWQQRIIPNLRQVFPNTQLIVATHSPQVLTTVQKEHIAILKDYRLHAASVNTFGAESKQVMLEVMQTENRPPDNANVDQLRTLFDLINQGQLEAAARLNDDLIDQWGADDPALIEAQATIKNRQWEKELGL